MSIQFDYTKTMQQAARLDEIANDLLAISNKRMTASIDNIGAAWSGESSTEFLKCYTKIQEDLRNKANYLIKTAQTLRETAKTIKDTDDKAKGIISNGLARG